MKKIAKKLKGEKVVKDFFAMVSTNIILQPVQVIKGFVVANFLGPADYGLLKSIELIQMLNKFGNLGFKTVAQREIADAKSKGDIERETSLRDTNYTAENLLAFLLFIIGSISAIFIESGMLSLLVFLASTGLLIRKIQGIFLCETSIQKRFVLQSKNTLYTGLLTCALVIASVPWLKIYAILLTNIVVGAFGIYHLRKNLQFSFKFKINKKELKNSIKIGVPFTLATLAFASYKYSERILVINYISDEALGYFSFGMMVVGNFTILFKMAIKVRMQDIWEMVGAGKHKKVHAMVIKETFFLTLASIILIPILWYAVEFLVPMYLPKWTGGIKAAQYLTFSMPFMVIANYAHSVTTSTLINKIRYPIYMRLISTGILFLGTILLHQKGMLTVENYILVNIAGYAFYNMSLLVAYKFYFMNKFIHA